MASQDDAVAQLIRDARLAKKMSQEELSDRIGVKQQAVSKWETGQTKRLDIPTALKLAVILDLDSNELLSAIGVPEGIDLTLLGAVQRIAVLEERMEGMQRVLDRIAAAVVDRAPLR